MATLSPDPDPGTGRLQLDPQGRPWAAGLSADELHAFVQWQNTAYYHAIQAFLRTGIGSAEAEAYATAIDAAIARAVLPAGMPLFRGIRSAQDAFGLDRTELRRLMGADPLRLAGFFATSLSERIALRFTGDEPGPGGQVLMRMVTAEACRGAVLDDLPTANRWIEDQEVLIGPRRPIRITSVDVLSHLTIVEGVVH